MGLGFDSEVVILRSAHGPNKIDVGALAALSKIGLKAFKAEPISERDMMQRLIATWRGRLSEMIPDLEAAREKVERLEKMVAFGREEIRTLEEELDSSIDQ